jgi:hypothetical protein
MTNKELASRLAKTGQGIPVADLVLIEEAARRLRELPDLTAEPEPPLTLRGLVEKHECLGRYARFRDEAIPFWEIADAEGPYTSVWHRVTEGVALSHVRGIVKAMCDERNTDSSWAKCWSWRPTKHTHWIFNAGEGGYFHVAATELEAIDALLIAMQVGKG